MKYCENFAALLDPFVDGELSPGEMARVQAHLDECPACRAYVDDALAIRAAFPDAEDTELPDGFAESVMARIQAEAVPRAEAASQTEAVPRAEAASQTEAVPRAETAHKKKPSRPWLKALASLAACCAIVLLVGPLFSGGAKTEAPAAAADTAASTERAMVSSEEAAEEAAPAEAPAAETYYTAGTAEAEPQAPAAAAAGPEEDQASFKANSPDVQMQAADGGSISTLTLPPEAASLLADFAPVEETDTEARYELTRQDCDVLTESLTQADIAFTLDDADSDTVLVILEK